MTHHIHIRFFIHLCTHVCMYMCMYIFMCVSLYYRVCPQPRWSSSRVCALKTRCMNSQSRRRTSSGDTGQRLSLDITAISLSTSIPLFSLPTTTTNIYSLDIKVITLSPSLSSSLDIKVISLSTRLSFSRLQLPFPLSFYRH